MTIDGPDVLPRLPAAVEVAAYRIATEALTNVARHSRAASASVVVAVNGCLTLRVVDGGGPAADAWTPGVGLIGMRERAAELGGTLFAGPGPEGGEVSVTLPLESDLLPGAGGAS